MEQEIASLYDAAGQGDLRAVKDFLARGEAVDAVPNEYCCTPLANAAGKGHMAIVELLLARGAGINFSKYRTPLESAIAGKQQRMALYLLAQGADWSNGNMLIEKSITNELPDVAEALIRRGASTTAEEAGAALLLAASNGQLGVVECLLDNGAAVDAKNRQSKTALHQAASAGKLDVVRRLLSAGADASAVDDHLRTPLHLAASAGRHEAAQALLDGGAEVNARDSLGATPLHMSVRKGSLSTTETLMLGGASPEVPDYLGNTIRARAQDNTGILEILCRPGMPYHRTIRHSAIADPREDAEQDRARAISCITRRVTEIVALVADAGISPTEILPTTNFVNELNFDSLETIELVMEFEDEFDIKIPDEEAEKMCTAGDVVDYVLKVLLPPSVQMARPAFSS